MNRIRNIKKNYVLYLFLLPSFLYLALFHYWPLYGVQIAFKDFKATEGIWGSPWVGLDHFTRFFESFQFWQLLQNTITISLYALIMGFPIPILLALILNYMTIPHFKRFAQTVTYAPHFISTVVMAGMVTLFLSPSSGLINTLLGVFGLEPVSFMQRPDLFKHIYVWSGIWQDTGWGSVIYMAALSAVSPELHEAAIVDGASKWKRIWNIDIPAILPTAVIILIMNVGSVMSVGFEKVYLLQNDANLAASEIFSTYVYKIGIQSAQYSYSTAIGLFNNVINFVLLISVNQLSRKWTGSSLW